MHYIYSDELIGIPLLPGTQISSLHSSFRIQDHTHDVTLNVPIGTEYFTRDAGISSDHYTINLPYKN